MTSLLEARFERRYIRGPAIQADLEMPATGFSVTVLYGPSGCGKSTVLRCLAGLDRPDSGIIRCGGDVWFDAEAGICRTPQQRRTGLLVQDGLLFPHLSVSENIGYSLRARPRTQRQDTVRVLLERFRLTDVANRLPGRISGGQQQRAALARCLAARPRLLLLDEPLSALDDRLRRELRRELRDFLAEFAVPVVLVTHDRMEALALADTLVVMDDGRILQSGSLESVFGQPASRRVAEITGTDTVLDGTVADRRDGLITVSVGDVRLLAVAPDRPSRRVHLCIRAEDVVLQNDPGTAQSIRNRFPVCVRRIVPEGALVRVVLDAGFILEALITRQACDALNLKPGQRLTACIKTAAIHVIPVRDAPDC